MGTVGLLLVRFIACLVLYLFALGSGNSCEARNIALAEHVRPALETVSVRHPMFAVGRALLNQGGQVDQFATQAVLEYLRSRNDRSTPAACFSEFYQVKLGGRQIQDEFVR